MEYESAEQNNIQNEGERIQGEKIKTKINPFDEKSQIPEEYQTQGYKKAYRELKSLWNAYLKGDLDIEELTQKADKIVNEFIKNFNGVKQTSAFLKQADSLFHIQRRFADENYSDEVQAAKKKAWNNFGELQDRYTKARENNELSADEKTLKKLITNCQKS